MKRFFLLWGKFGYTIFMFVIGTIVAKPRNVLTVVQEFVTCFQTVQKIVAEFIGYVQKILENVL